MDWSKIKKEYLKGKISYRELAEKYNVPFGTLRKVAAKEKWKDLRDKTRAKTDMKTIEIISDGEADRAKRLMSVTDKLLDRIEGLVEEFTAGEVLLDKTTLKQLTGALKDIKDIQGIKNPIDIEEQRARIENLKKNNNAGKEDENTYGVVFIPARSPKPVPPGDDLDG